MRERYRVGWKNVREHYKIDHIVHVRDGKIYVGSPYVSEIIEIDGGVPKWKSVGLSRRSGDKLDRYMSDMEADPAKLKELIDTPDTFERSITVWTCDYYEGRIIEKQCEEPGWPHCTHDGELMYENSFSTDRAEIVEYARRNAAAGAEQMERRVREIEADLKKAKETRDQFAAALRVMA